MTLLTDLYPYQKQGIKRLLKFDGRALLADEMGLGKSIQSIGYYAQTADRYRGRPVVVVCPAGLRFNWQNEFRQHAGVAAVVLEGRVAKPETPTGAAAYIVGYEIIGRATDPKSWSRFLKKLKPFLIVVDECHKIKSRTAQQTRNVFGLGKKVPHRICMSGTPIVNMPAELWTVLHFLRPDKYPGFRQYADRYCRPERKPWGWEFKGADNLDELHADLLTTMMIRRLKSDVLHQLPPKVRHVVPLAIVRRGEYKEAFDNFIRWIRRFKGHKLRAVQRAKVLAQSGYLLRLAAELKLPAVLEWTATWLADNPGKKLILFAKHLPVLDAIYQRFHKQAVLIQGSVAMRKREAAVTAFQKDAKTRLFVGQIDAAGTGWNGTAASAVAFAEFDWRPGIMRQAEDRGHRIGQHRALDCFYLTAHGTFEEKVAGVIQDKQAVANQVLDGAKGGNDEMSVYDMLMTAIKGDL